LSQTAQRWAMRRTEAVLLKQITAMAGPAPAGGRRAARARQRQLQLGWAKVHMVGGRGAMVILHLANIYPINTS
jgi:hypothetical protein